MNLFSIFMTQRIESQMSDSQVGLADEWIESKMSDFYTAQWMSDLYLERVSL